jgi:hypothetical protein
MATAESEFVILPVNGNMFVVLLAELLYRSLNRLYAALLAHLFRRVIGVATSTVPVSRKRLGMKGDLDIKLLSDADKKEASHPEMVSHLDAFAGTDLELPLRRHNFGVDTANIDAGVEAGSIVCLDQITGKDFASA